MTIRLSNHASLLAALALVSVLCMACKSSASSTPRSSTGGQQSPVATTIDFGELSAAYLALLNLAIEQPTSNQLLNAAWDGLIGEARKQGLNAAARRPTFRGDPRGDFTTFTTAFNRLAAAAPRPLDGTQLNYAAVDAMARSLHDSHTTFLPPDAFNRYNRREAGNLGTTTGFQLERTKAHPPLVLEVIPGSAADVAGLKAGDTVTAVNGRPVLSYDLDVLSRTLEGPDGSKLELDIRRAGSARSQRLTVVRRTIALDTVAGKVLAGNVGYLRIRQFPSAQFVILQVQQALADFAYASTRGIIVDLRDNPGGAVNVLLPVAGQFVSQSPIAYTVGRDGVPKPLQRAGPFNLHQRVVVLVDAGSASSAEIMAGAIQEYGDGLVLGVRTCGCLLDAFISQLPDGKSGLEVGVARVLTPVRKLNVEGAGLSGIL